MSERRPAPTSEEMRERLHALESSRIPAHRIPWLEAALCRFANVDPTDCPDDAERRGYASIGTSLAFASLFALFGWSAFFAMCGLDDAVGGGRNGTLVVALIACVMTGAVIAFDRGFTGHQDAGLGSLDLDDPLEDIPAANATPAQKKSAQARALELLHPLGHLDRRVYRLRLIVAFGVAFVFSLSVESVFLEKDVHNQQVKDQKAIQQGIIDQVAAREAQLKRDHDKEIDRFTALRDTAKRNAQNAIRGSRNSSKCGPECLQYQQSEKDYDQDIKDANAAWKTDAERARLNTRSVAANSQLDRLEDGVLDERLRGGPLTRFTAMATFVFWPPRPMALLIWLFFGMFVLAVDLAAIVRKSQLRDCGYERRQAIRARINHRYTASTSYQRNLVADAAARSAAQKQVVQLRVDHQRVLADAAADGTEQHLRRAANESIANDPELVDHARAAAHQAMAERISGGSRPAAKPRTDTASDAPTPSEFGPAPAGPGRVHVAPDEERTQLLVVSQFEEGPTVIEDQLSAGDTIRGKRGIYRLERVLHPRAKNGSTEIWVAEVRSRQTKGAARGSNVAVKIHYAPKDPGNERAFRRRQRATNEARVTERLEDSGYVVQFLDASETDDRVAIVTRLLEGDLGTEWHHDGGERRLFDVVAAATQIAAAVKAAELDHGDIKPGNCLLDGRLRFNGRADWTTPRIRLADWEVARKPGDLNERTWLPRGTARYAAPQVRNQGEASDLRDTLFSIACLIWTGVTGTPPGTWEFGPRANEPVTGDGLLTALAARRERGELDANGRLAPMLHHFAPAVPRSLSLLVNRWLSYSRESRSDSNDFQAIGDAERKLGEILTELSVQLGTSDQVMVGPKHTLQEPHDDRISSTQRPLPAEFRGGTSSDGDDLPAIVDPTTHPASRRGDSGYGSGSASSAAAPQGPASRRPDQWVDRNGVVRRHDEPDPTGSAPTPGGVG